MRQALPPPLIYGHRTSTRGLCLRSPSLRLSSTLSLVPCEAKDITGQLTHCDLIYRSFSNHKPGEMSRKTKSPMLVWRKIQMSRLRNERTTDTRRHRQSVRP